MTIWRTLEAGPLTLGVCAQWALESCRGMSGVSVPHLESVWEGFEL